MKTFLVMAILICGNLIAYGCLIKSPEKKMIWFGLPSLVRCSCDSAYRCISDADWMRLVVYDQQARHGKDYHE